jgi:predicted nucleic acid-binding protein
MLLDINFWIHLAEERGRHASAQPSDRGPAHRFMAAHRAAPFAISMITWGELAVGFQSAFDLDRLLRQTKVLSLLKQVAWEASRIQRELQQIGWQLSENDNWIAATARCWGIPVVTRDAAFGRVPRLRILTY